MEGWQQVLATYPFLQSIWDGLIIAVPLSMMLAFSSIFFISAIAKIYSISRRRTAFNKCAKQIACIGIILGWCLLVGGRVWLYYTQPQHEAGTLLNFMLEMSWMLLSIGVLLSTIYYFLWNALKNMPVLLTTIGMISAVQNTLALISILCSIRLAAAISSPDAAAMALPDLFPDSWNDPLYSTACYTIPLMFALAGAFSACWLSIRRRKDDFGRDYYSTMIPWCCAWARNGWAILWLILFASSVLQFYQNLQLQIPDREELLYEGARLLIWLIPPLLWTSVIRASLPLRLLILPFIALIIACFFMLPYFLELTLIQS